MDIAIAKKSAPVRKLLAPIVFVSYSTFFLSLCTYAQTNSTDILNEINKHLQFFDKGYYGRMEIKDGFLVNYFRDGKNYRKIKLTDLNDVKLIVPNEKIAITCKQNTDCVFSTFTNSYHNEFAFSETGGNNIHKLRTLLTEFISTYTGNNFDRYKSNMNVLESNPAGKQQNEPQKNTGVNSTVLYDNLKNAFDAFNAHVVKLDGGRYWGLEVKDGYLYSYYGDNKYSKAKLEDIDYVSANKQYNYVKLGCAGNRKCVYSTITGSYHDYFNFNSGPSTIDQTTLLLNNFLTALKANLNAAATNSTQQKPIDALNAYLKIYNSGTYKNVVVEGNDVLFHFTSFGGNYYSKISKQNLKNNILIEDVNHNTFRIKCKNNASCFYSTYDDEMKDHFQFFTYNPQADKAKLKALLEAFIASL
ncbi:hypothetical protein IQ13_0769 [Lacibacter cauensis]|uniref:Uncharacterized protein n=1 Tax=Lacibacter cauensis TaxID=510947 RepID=A0A562SXZ5_9BACT|nr:hypothetical protein [Lacibacter cauensis]TWI85606.1 hypothetical protein IQ13_0769 [Lacibacter cauensis]